jgi:hypothetical protein
MSKPEGKSEQMKRLLAHHTGSLAAEWKRVSQKRFYGDVDREFENKKTGEKISVSERPDGLLYALLPDDRTITARLPIPAKIETPAVTDVVLNACLDDKEVPADLYKRAVAGGLAGHFNFCVYKGDLGDGEPYLFATIYPAVRDETFKCPDFIRPMAPGAEGVDECVVTEWHFGENYDSPAEIARRLRALGFRWDREAQKHQKDIYAEIKGALTYCRVKRLEPKSGA